MSELLDLVVLKLSNLKAFSSDLAAVPKGFVDSRSRTLLKKDARSNAFSQTRQNMSNLWTWCIISHVLSFTSGSRGASLCEFEWEWNLWFCWLSVWLEHVQVVVRWWSRVDENVDNHFRPSCELPYVRNVKVLLRACLKKFLIDLLAKIKINTRDWQMWRLDFCAVIIFLSIRVETWICLSFSRITII